MVVIEGSDFTEASLAVELDLNIDAASHLGSPVLLVVGGRRRTAEQVLDAVHQGLGMLTERGCVLLGVICNRVAPDLVDAIRAGIAEAAGGLPAAVLPEVPLLAAPTIAEVAARLDAEHLARPGRRRRRPPRARSPGSSSGRWGCRCSWSGSARATW